MRNSKKKLFVVFFMCLLFPNSGLFFLDRILGIVAFHMRLLPSV